MMMRKTYLNYAMLTVLIGLLLVTQAHARTLVWTFSPLTEIHISDPIKGEGVVSYTVTNQSNKTHTLQMKHIPGIQASGCTAPVGSHQSCTLNLVITSSDPKRKIVSDLALCEQGNSNACYQLSRANSLNTTQGISVDYTAGVSLTNDTTLSVSATGTIPVYSGSPDTPGTLTVTNTGTYTATNVSALLPISWIGVTQTATCTDCASDATSCTEIAPGDTCTLNFTSTTPYVAQGNITITGDNITTPPTTALAFTAQGYLIWQVSGSTVWVIDTADLSLLPVAWGGYGTAIGSSGQSFTDGVDNTTAIVTTLGIGSAYAAEGCNQSTNGGASAGAWYLPAICEMGSAGGNAGCSLGLANIDTNLVQLGFGALSGYYWSSTEHSPFAEGVAWFQYFAAGGFSGQGYGYKFAGFGVRCAQVLTL